MVKEFYGDLDIDHDKGVPEGIKFTLFGEQREFSVDELNQALKMVTLMEAKTKGYKSAVRVVPNLTDRKWSGIWSKMVGKEDTKFKSCDAKRTSLKDPTIQMCHRILSFNLYGKKDSSATVSKSELYILWATHEKTRLNFAAFAILHMRSILGREQQRLSLCRLPTIFAKKNDLRGPDFAMTPEREDSFDLKTLKKMFRIEEDKDRIRMLTESEKTIARPTSSISRAREGPSATPEPA